MRSRSSAPRKILLGLLALGVVAGVTTIPGGDAYADVETVRSAVKGADGKDYWVENTIDTAAAEDSRGASTRPEYMVVWAGDENVADTVVPDVKPCWSLRCGRAPTWFASPARDIPHPVPRTAPRSRPSR